MANLSLSRSTRVIVCFLVYLATLTVGLHATMTSASLLDTDSKGRRCSKQLDHEALSLLPGRPQHCLALFDDLSAYLVRQTSCG